jgi:hypothetical protein
VEKDRILATQVKSDAAGLDDLAVSQGVSLVTDFDALLGHPASEDESVDEFSAMLREWRSEGTSEGRNWRNI